MGEPNKRAPQLSNQNKAPKQHFRSMTASTSLLRSGRGPAVFISPTHAALPDSDPCPAQQIAFKK